MKHLTLRSKRKKSSKKNNLRKKNSRNKKYRNKKTNKNRKSLRGGFNIAQFAGALAVAAALGKNKIVLIPKEASSKRYDIVLNLDIENIKNPSQGKFTIPGTRSNVNIKNFDIYVGSTEDTNLIKIEGNDSVIKRLAALTSKLAEPNNANAIINRAENMSLITGGNANNLNEAVNDNLTPNNLALIASTQESFQPDDNVFIKLIQTIFSILLLFFKILFSYLTASQTEGTVLVPPNTSANAPTPDNISQQVVAFISSEPNDESGPQLAQNVDEMINEIGSLPQFEDRGGMNIQEPVDNSFKCVKPYDRDTSTTKERIKSCNKTGIPHPSFSGRTWPGLQNCVNECYT